MNISPFLSKDLLGWPQLESEQSWAQQHMAKL